MKPFMDEEFLLSTPTAQKLYHDFAETMPILDYHCHINPEEIAKDVCLKILPRYGWAEIITNGDRCVRTVWMSTISQVMRLHGKNFKNGRKRWKKLWETRCSTGVIWN